MNMYCRGLKSSAGDVKKYHVPCTECNYEERGFLEGRAYFTPLTSSDSIRVRTEDQTGCKHNQKVFGDGGAV